MSVLPLYGTPIKRDIIEMAREKCAVAGYDFEGTPEEDRSALRQLQALMAEWEDNDGLALGFNYAGNGYGAMNDDSGIPRGALFAAGLSLALRLAPDMGKTLAPEAKQALGRSLSSLRANQSIPMMEMGRNTIRGAGNRRWVGAGRPYFVADVSDDEVAQ